MNDFSELENDLRALRPARPSPVLFERIEEAMAENRKASVAADAGPMASWLRRFTETPYRFTVPAHSALSTVQRVCPQSTSRRAMRLLQKFGDLLPGALAPTIRQNH